jgi:hypothetical protein
MPGAGCLTSDIAADASSPDDGNVHASLLLLMACDARPHASASGHGTPSMTVRMIGHRCEQPLVSDLDVL